MRFSAVLLALFPLCFAAPNVFGREYLRNRFRDEITDSGLLAGRTCLMECQTDYGEFNISTSSRPLGHEEYCEFAQKLSECFDKCPESPASPLAKQNAEIYAQICGKDFDESKFEALRFAQARLMEYWIWQALVSCPRYTFGSPRMFDKCSLFLDCMFGDALNALKDGYDDLAVASIVVPLKLHYSLEIGGGVWTEDVVDECSVLFTTFEASDTEPSSLSAPACLQYCQTTATMKIVGNPETNEQPDKALYCEHTRGLDDCLGKCQESPISAVIEQLAGVNAEICAAEFDEQQLKDFLDDQRRLVDKWSKHAEACAKDSAGLGGADFGKKFVKCNGYTNCYFGKAFDAVKEDFDELVVAATSAQLKIAQAQMVGQGVWTKDVVDGCSILFKPYEARDLSSGA
ncbi:hypothetical protein AAVH_07627 [Aphelenchoides avenae]|nr:hypothetical protein AAVH_07627 [Aphelenchus avenae]